jgi:hypothetical protein
VSIVIGPMDGAVTLFQRMQIFGEVAIKRLSNSR